MPVRSARWRPRATYDLAYESGKGNVEFTVVGYGLQLVKPVELGEKTRYVGTVSLVNLKSSLTDGWNIHYSSNPGQGHGGSGGTCFGDSGGPVIHDGVIVGVNSFVLNLTCKGARSPTASTPSSHRTSSSELAHRPLTLATGRGLRPSPFLLMRRGRRMRPAGATLPPEIADDHPVASPIIETKVTVPGRRSRLVKRGRLADRLDGDHELEAHARLGAAGVRQVDRRGGLARDPQREGHGGRLGLAGCGRQRPGAVLVVRGRGAGRRPSPSSTSARW